MQSANTALQDALRSEHDAQAQPIGAEHAPLQSPGLPTGLTYTLDLSSAFALGNTGYTGNGLPGGYDAVVGYGFNKHFRLQAGEYTFQEYPLGFNTGTVPVYVQGLANPVKYQDLSAAPQNNFSVVNHVFVLNAETLITIAKKFPIVITPSYYARTGTIGNQSDLLPLQVNGPANGYSVLVHYRTVQYYLIALTIPVLSSPKFFGTLTIAPQWNVNLGGVQTTNHAQLFELAYFEFRPTKNTAIFFQPSRLVNNLPTDQTPQYIPTFIYGLNYKFTKYTFFQAAWSTGTPSNRSTLGIQAVTIGPLGQAPTLGGLKASQVQLQYGIGSPSVIPL